MTFCEEVDFAIVRDYDKHQYMYLIGPFFAIFQSTGTIKPNKILLIFSTISNLTWERERLIKSKNVLT